MPWLVFAMSFGIAFGVAQDPALRAELRSNALTAANGALALGAVKLETWLK